MISNENTIDDDGLASDLANLDALSAQFDSLSIRTPFKQTDDEDITLNKLETDTSEVSSTGHDRTSKANQKLAFDNTQDAFEKDSGSNEINQESNEFDKEFQVVDVKYNYNDENVKKTKSKGVTFDVDANDDIKVTSRDISSIGLQDADASINQSASDSLTKDSDSFGFNDDDFQPAGKGKPTLFVPEIKNIVTAGSYHA